MELLGVWQDEARLHTMAGMPLALLEVCEKGTH